MLKTRILLGLFLILGALSSCKKELSPEKQAAKDEAKIVEFIAKNNILAKRDASGLYYSEMAPGTGIKPSSSSTVKVKYEGRLLNGKVFDNGGGKEVEFPLSRVIAGWQIGIPLAKKGGKIRLIIPSGLAYGSQPSGSIAANSILDFTVELIDVQ